MLRVAASVRDRHAAVPADIGEHPKPAVFGAHHQQRLAEQVDGPVVAGRRRLLDAADAQPFLSEQLVDLDLQELRRRVEAGRHAPGPVVRPVEAGAKRLAHAFHRIVPQCVSGCCHVTPHLASGATPGPPPGVRSVTSVRRVSRAVTAPSRPCLPPGRTDRHAALVTAHPWRCVPRAPACPTSPFSCRGPTSAEARYTDGGAAPARYPSIHAPQSRHSA